MNYFSTPLSRLVLSHDIPALTRLALTENALIGESPYPPDIRLHGLPVEYVLRHSAACQEVTRGYLCETGFLDGENSDPIPFNAKRRIWL